MASDQKPKRKPTIKQILNALERQILFGKTYLAISKGLYETEPIVYGTASTFFGLTGDGSLVLAAMTIARLFDKSRRSVTLPRMLLQAETEVGSFCNGSQVREAVCRAKAVVTGLESVLAAIKLHRDEWFAHLGANTVMDQQAKLAEANVTIPDLDRAFEETENIIKEFTRLLDGRTKPLRFVGDDDYKSALKHIRRSREAEMAQYRKAIQMGE